MTTLQNKYVDENLVLWALCNCKSTNPGVGEYTQKEIGEILGMWHSQVNQMLNFNGVFRKFEYLRDIRVGGRLPDDMAEYILEQKRLEVRKEINEVQREYAEELAELQRAYDERILFLEQKLERI